MPVAGETHEPEAEERAGHEVVGDLQDVARPPLRLSLLCRGGESGEVGLWQSDCEGGERLHRLSPREGEAGAEHVMAVDQGLERLAEPRNS